MFYNTCNKSSLKMNKIQKYTIKSG